MGDGFLPLVFAILLALAIVMAVRRHLTHRRLQHEALELRAAIGRFNQRLDTLESLLQQADETGVNGIGGNAPPAEVERPQRRSA